MNTPIAIQFEAARPELRAYLCRLVVRPQIAEDLVQTTFLRCFEALDRMPGSETGNRAWFFKVATNLAFDELKRHSTWRENMLDDIRIAAEADAGLVADSMELAGTPETKTIAKEHLVACMACTLRNLPEQKAATLLLREIHGFSSEEIAEILGASFVQVKNWLQEARTYMDHRYGATCALITKRGVCDQCVELAGFFSSPDRSPLEAGNLSLDARLDVARQMREKSWGPWHRMIFRLIDDMK